MALLTTLLGLCVLVVVHPYVTYPLSLVVMRALGRVDLAPTGPAPKRFAVVCCVYNEKAVIKQKIENMRAVRERLGDCQLLIHSDGSTDGTNEILQELASDFSLSLAEKRSGKSTGMNRLLAMTDAEVVIFTDANVTMDPDSAKNLERYFSDPKVGCVTGHLVYLNATESETARVGSLYWRFEEWVKQLESDTGSVMGADGSLFAIRRELFQPVPADIIDDFCTSMSILCAGSRIVRGSDFLAYERSASSRSDEFRRKVRIACRAFNCHRLLWPKIQRLDGLSFYKYMSHKYVRWLAGYFFVAGAALSVVLAYAWLGLLGAAGLLALLAIAAVIAGNFSIPVLTTIWEVVMAMAATALGVYRSLRGERFQTWQIASSTRK